MSSRNDDERMTDSELSTFAHKISGWSRGLTPKEQTFLEQMVVCAANFQPGDVHGYDDVRVQPDSLAGSSSIELPGPAIPGLDVESLTFNFLKINSNQSAFQQGDLQRP